MYSLKKRVLLIFSLLWISMLALFSGITYLNYRQVMLKTITLLGGVGANNEIEIYFRSYGIEYSQFFNNPEALISKLFWQEYQQTIILTILVGGIILLSILIIMNRYLTRFFTMTTTLLSLDEEERTVQLPSEFLEVSHNIQKSKEQIRTLHDQNKQFQAYASHELRNELITLKGMLYQYHIKEPAIQQQQQLLEKTVEDLLILSYSLETATKEKIDPLLVLAEVIDTFGATQNIHFQFDESAEWGQLLTRENWLYRLFYNIIDNAIRYRKMETNIYITATTTQKTCIITITNTGAKALTETSNFLTDVSGHGIGLKLVNHVTNAIGGRYYYEIENNQVTTIVSLPLLAK